MPSETDQQPDYRVHTVESLKSDVTGVRGCALTVGNFDGVHCGHQSSLARVREVARTTGAPAVALTFEPHPVRFFRPDTHPFRLTTPKQKLLLLRRFGIGGPTVVSFDRNLAELEPETFIRRILLGVFRPSRIVVGYDFNFGKNRRGNPQLLQTMSDEHGIPTEVQPAVDLGGDVVSSTTIRKALRSGDVGRARHLLGRPFALLGRVTTGAGRGRDLGFPTANVLTENELLPALGVYATLLETRRATWRAITNVGVRPTFGEDKVTVESFVLDPQAPDDLDLYDEPVAVHVLERLREEQKFPSPEALIAQIQRDIEQCREIHASDPCSDLVPQSEAVQA